MGNINDDLRRLIEGLPDDVTWDEVQYRIYVREQIAKGQNDLTAGRIVDEIQADERLARWFV